MEESEKIQNKLPNQEIDYFKIGKILLSRWYWIIGSLTICLLISNVYLWYTPKTFATAGTMKFEEKKSELPDLVGSAAATDRANSSRIQTETIVLQSTPLLLSAIKELDYRFSFYIVGRVISRTSDLYPQKPLDISLIKFDSLNFFRAMVTFKPINKNTFSIGYKYGGKNIQFNCKYDVPFSLGTTVFSIKYPGELSQTTGYLFKLNTPEDFIGRVRGGFHTQETAKNSNIISLQEIDFNPQFAADVLNAIMREYLNYDRNQRTLSTTHMINFINSQLDVLSTQVKGSANSIKDFKQDKKIMDLTSASDQAIGKVKEIDIQRSDLNLQLIAIDLLKQQIIKEKNDASLSFNLGGVVDPQLDQIISNLAGLISQKNSLLKTYNSTSEEVLDLDKQILQVKIIF